MNILNYSDVICEIFSYLTDVQTIKNITLTDKYLNHCARKAIKIIDQPISYAISRQFKNLEYCSVKINRFSQFSALLISLHQLKRVYIQLTEDANGYRPMKQIIHAYGILAQTMKQIPLIALSLRFEIARRLGLPPLEYDLNLSHYSIKIHPISCVEGSLSEADGISELQIYKLIAILQKYNPVKIISLPYMIVNRKYTIEFLKTLPHLEQINIYPYHDHFEIAQALVDRLTVINGEHQAIVRLCEPSLKLRKFGCYIYESELSQLMSLYPNLTEISINVFELQTSYDDMFDLYPHIELIHIDNFIAGHKHKYEISQSERILRVTGVF